MAGFRSYLQDPLKDWPLSLALEGWPTCFHPSLDDLIGRIRAGLDVGFRQLPFQAGPGYLGQIVFDLPVVPVNGEAKDIDLLALEQIGW